MISFKTLSFAKRFKGTKDIYHPHHIYNRTNEIIMIADKLEYHWCLLRALLFLIFSSSITQVTFVMKLILHNSGYKTRFNCIANRLWAYNVKVAFKLRSTLHYVLNLTACRNFLIPNMKTVYLQ